MKFAREQDLDRNGGFTQRFPGTGCTWKAFLYRELLKPALRLAETTMPGEGIPMHYRISRRA